MKVKTKYLCTFYKNRGKWIGPTNEELWTKEEIIYNDDSVNNYLKLVRKHFKKPVKLMRMVYYEEKV